MNKENASKTISLIDEKYINEATEFAVSAGGSGKKQCLPEQSGRHALRKRWAVAAACLAVVIIAGSTMFAFAAEAAEYRTAVAFFDQYGLSSEGLSRAEIKAVYRDITTKSFKNGKKLTVKGTAKTVKNLKANKKYYVRVRTFKTIKGVKYYSKWSEAKTVKTK